MFPCVEVFSCQPQLLQLLLHPLSEEDLLEEPEIVDVEEEEEGEEGGEESGEQPPILEDVEEGVAEQPHTDPTPAEVTQENVENKQR